MSEDRRKYLESLKVMSIAEFAELKGISTFQVYDKLKKFPDCLDTEGKPLRIIYNSKAKRYNTDLRTKTEYKPL